MKRSLIYLGIVGAVFAIGVFAWIVVSTLRARHLSDEPLRLTVSPIQPANSNVSFDHYVVRVENVSAKTVQGFSLGHTCRCRSWDSENNPYPPGISYTNPSPERQVLRPGDVHQMPLPADIGPDPNVWVDLVHFAKDGNWGPNLSHKDSYVRGY